MWFGRNKIYHRPLSFSQGQDIKGVQIGNSICIPRGEGEEDVFEVGFLGREVDDGEAALLDRAQDLADGRVARLVADGEAARGRQFGVEGAQSRRDLGQILGEGDGQGLAVEVLQEGLRGVAGDQPSLVDDGDAVAEAFRFLEVMGREQDRRAASV